MVSGGRSDSAMIPGLWLTEGGQSATGALIDHIVFSHVRSHELEQDAKRRGITVYEILAEVLDKLAAGTRVSRRTHQRDSMCNRISMATAPPEPIRMPAG